MSHPAISAGEAGRPMPKSSPAAATSAFATSHPSSAATTARLTRIGHRSVLPDVPGLYGVVVIVGTGVARLEQIVAARLDVAGFVGRTAGQRRRAARPAPRQSESRQAL